IGYREVTAPALELAAADSVEVELRMATDAVPLAPLTVTARAHLAPRQLRVLEFEARRKRGFGDFLTAEDIRRVNPFRTTDLLKGMSGVKVDDRRVGSMAGRDGQRCIPVYYIDGIMIERLDGEIDEFVPAGTVRAVEVYRRASA